jgi:L-ascorbate metabolism protein UlaG (beta-lactamase superfamily)
MEVPVRRLLDGAEVFDELGGVEGFGEEFDSYRTVHTSPEEAVQAFLDTGASLMIPMHYGTFRLGREPMTEPLERLASEAVRLNIDSQVRVVAEGETLRLPNPNAVKDSQDELSSSAR